MGTLHKARLIIYFPTHKAQWNSAAPIMLMRKLRKPTLVDYSMCTECVTTVTHTASYKDRH